MRKVHDEAQIGAESRAEAEGDPSENWASRVAELMTHLLALDSEQIDSGIARGLDTAGQIVNAKVTSITSISPHALRPIENYHWDGSYLERRSPEKIAELTGVHAWSAARLMRGERIVIEDRDALPEDAAPLRAWMQDNGIGCMLSLPICDAGRTVGIFSFLCVEAQTDRFERHIDHLRMVAGAVVGILQRRQAESAREESEARFQILTENAEDPILEFDDQGRMLYASPSVERLLGYTPEELREIDWKSFVSHDYARALKMKVDGQPSNRWKSGPVSVRIKHRLGHEIWLESNHSSFLTSEGNQRTVVVMRDVTEQHRARSVLEDRLQRESLVADLARSFVSPAAGELDDRIAANLEIAAIVAQADRCFLVAMEMSSESRPKLYQWCDEQGAEINAQFPIDVDAFPWTLEKLLNGECLSIRRVDSLPPEASAERSYLMQSGAVSYLAIPVHSAGEFLGCLAFHYLKETDWSEPQLTQLRLVGELFTSALRRKISHASLQESEERFRALTEHSRDPICEVDEKGMVLYASPSLEALLSFDTSQLLGTRFIELVNVADIGAVLGTHVSSLQGQDTERVTFRSLGRNGGELTFEATSQCYSMASGERRVVYVLRDVTERQRTQMALERQLSLEKKLAEFSRSFLATPTDEIDQRIKASLETAARLAGADRAWLISFSSRQQPAHDVFYWWDPALDGIDNRTPRISESDVERITEIFDASSVLHLPDFNRTEDEHPTMQRRMVGRGVRSFLGIPLYASDAPTAFLGFESVRHRKSWGEEEVTLLRIVGEIFVSALDRKASEHALRESEAQLLQAQKMEAVGTLAGGIAHDFNNHLAVMLGNARYVIGRVDDDPDLQDAMGDLNRSAEHCSQLTRSLLAFSRRTPVMTRPLDVGLVVAEASELLRPLLPATIEFEAESGEGLESITADPTKLQQVLVNLAVNARDAMPDGGRLTLSTNPREIDDREAKRLGLRTAGTYVELAVRDTGTGMSPEVRKRIFEPFFTTKELGKGTGLGLATAYGVVQENNGAIEVESELGVGTTFRVILPLATEDDSEAPAAEEEPNAGGSETILLVEDERGVRRLLSRILRGSGYEVLEAEDGIAALEVAEVYDGEIHLLVSDLIMPNLGGRDLADQMASLRPGTRVLFLSGYADFDDSARPIPAGSRYLQKPFSDEDLLTQVRLLLDVTSRPEVS